MPNIKTKPTKDFTSIRTCIRSEGKIVKWDYTFKDEVLTEEEIAAARSLKADSKEYNK